MSQYSQGFKARLVARMAGPDRITAAQLAEEVGVHQTTLSRWLREAAREVKRGNGVQANTTVRRSRSVRPQDLSAEEKLRLVEKAAKLSEKELGAFLRHHGLHEAQLEEWRKKIEEAALGALAAPKKKGRKGRSPEARRIRELERELNRKDKALAEVTALLALKKKLEALLGDEDENTTPRSER